MMKYIIQRNLQIEPNECGLCLPYVPQLTSTALSTSRLATMLHVDVACFIVLLSGLYYHF